MQIETPARVAYLLNLQGPAIAIGTPDLVIAADGINSFTLKQTGIRVAETAPLGTFVAAPVEVPPGRDEVVR